MSTRSKAKRATARKPAQSSGGPATRSRLQRAQDELTKAGDKYRAAQNERAQAVRAEWESGVSAQVIAQTLKISRSKVYEILSKAGGTRQNRSPRAAS